MSIPIQSKKNLVPRPCRLLWSWKSLLILLVTVFSFSALVTQKAHGDDLAVFSNVASAFENLATTLFPFNKDGAARKFDGVIFKFYNNYQPATNAQGSAGSIVSNISQTPSAKGEVMLAGGVGGRGLIGLVDLYNPVTATWLNSGVVTTTTPEDATAPRFNIKALIWCSFVVAF
jgi:hypothetical protein